jgi:tight adherence protein B
VAPSMQPRPVRRAVAVFAGLVAATVGATAAAVAAPSPVASSVSSLSRSGDALTGVLTVRGGGDALTIETRTLRATIAGKQYPVSTKPVTTTKRATMLVVDTSGSMGATGMQTVRGSVGAFLADAPKDVAVGLVSFAGSVGVDVRPTVDRKRIQSAVNALKSRGETSLYDAVALAAPALAAYDDRSLVLLSDGGDTASRKATRAQATALLKKYGVRAEVVAFKTAESDTSVLNGFAQAGGGSVAAAGNPTAVRSAFEAAAKVLDSQIAFTVKPDATLASTQEVTITGTAGGRPFTAKTAFEFGAPTATPTPPPTTGPDAILADGAAAPAIVKIKGPTGLSVMVLTAAAAIFLGLLGFGIALIGPRLRSDRSKRVETIERYVNPTTSVQMAPSAVSPHAVTANLVNIGERVMAGRESTSKTMALIERADLPLRAGEWWVLRVVAIFAAVAATMLLLDGGVLMKFFAAVLGLGLGLVLPAFVLRFLAKRRTKKFETQLPDVLTLVASSLSTGFSLLQALDAVAKDAAEPAAKEFSRALAETRIGADVGDALDRMAERTGSVNMRWTTMAIKIQREVGGNLAETLRTTAKTIREREELRRHVRGLSAEGRLSAYILIAMPIGIFLYTMKTNRDYIELLWTRPLGLAMLAGGIVSLGVGVFWMRKVVDVQV